MLRMRNLRWKILVSAAVLLIGLQSSAIAAVDPSDYVVGEVHIEGNKLISTEEILSVMKTHAGDRFSREQIMEDLKAINNLGYFDERKLEVNPALVDGKAHLSIKVEENAVIKSFAVRGNSLVPRAEILEPFAEQVGKPQNANKLSEAISKVESKYHDQGYVLAKVQDVVDSPDGKVELLVEEGIIDQVEVSGEPKSLREELSRANWLSFGEGKVYNEKRLTLHLREVYKKGQLHNICLSHVPLPGLPGKYVLKIELTPLLTRKAPEDRGFGCVGFSSRSLADGLSAKEFASLRHTQIEINRLGNPVKVWVEELYEDPRYELELVRRECSIEEAFGEKITLSSDERKLIKRVVRMDIERSNLLISKFPENVQKSAVRKMVGVRGYRAWADLAWTDAAKQSMLSHETEMRALLNPFGTKIPILNLYYPKVAKLEIDPKRVLLSPLLGKRTDTDWIVK